MEEIISIVIYSFLGIILMMVGTFMIDLVIPCEFPIEIKKKNVAVGYITAGASIAVGIILKAAVMSPVTEVIEETLFQGVVSTVLYFLLGIVLCVFGYFITRLFNRKYDLNREIEEGNPAAGLMIMGMFIGLSIIISGVMY